MIEVTQQFLYQSLPIVQLIHPLIGTITQFPRNMHLKLSQIRLVIVVVLTYNTGVTEFKISSLCTI